MAVAREPFAASDIQIRVLAELSGGYDVRASDMPKEVHCTASFGQASLSFELVLVQEDDRALAGRGGGGKARFRYIARNPTADGLEHYRYLDQLEGITFRFPLPKKKLEAPPGRLTYYVDLYVKGRFFHAQLQADGVALAEVHVAPAE